MFLALFSGFIGGVFSDKVDYFANYEFSSNDNQCAGLPTDKLYFVRNECYGYNYSNTDLSMTFELASNTGANMTLYAGPTCSVKSASYQIPFNCFHPADIKDEQWQFYNGQIITQRYYTGPSCTDAATIMITNSFKPGDCMPWHPQNNTLSLMPAKQKFSLMHARHTFSLMHGKGEWTNNTRSFMLNYMGEGLQVTTYSSMSCSPTSVIKDQTADFSLNICETFDDGTSRIFMDYTTIQ